MDPWLVVGLGNPGPRYQDTRHNIGAMVAQSLAARAATRLGSHRSRNDVAEVRLGTLSGAPGPRAVLACPQSFMNESGGPVKAAMQFWGVPLGQLVVVHDELDIPYGEIRLKRGGGEGGHNGLKSISGALGTKEYLRVRLGIGRPPGRMDPADYVLRPFSPVERRELPLVLGDAEDAVELLVHSGLEAAQLRFHSPRPS